MELVLIRHALPVRVIDENGGRVDPELTELGRRQSAAVADWLQGDRGAIDALYSSPLRRARETAAPLAERLGLTPTIVDDLAEWDRDSFAYIPMEELKAADHDVWRAMAEGRFDDLGIDVEAFRRRVTDGLTTIATNHPGQRVAVVAHGGVINSYVADVLALDSMLFFEPDYTSITRVLVARTGARSLRSLNETGHLRHS